MEHCPYLFTLLQDFTKEDNQLLDNVSLMYDK